MSVYVLGESLLTISKHRKYMETSYGSPQVAVFYKPGLEDDVLKADEIIS